MLLRCNPDTRITHIHTELNLTIADCGRPDKDPNFPNLGEFDGVTHQIDQHLTQSNRITNHVTRHFRLNFKDQFQFLFMCPQGQSFQCLSNHPMQIKGNHLDQQLACLDL